MTDMEHGAVLPSQVEEENKILEIQDLTLIKQASMKSANGQTAIVSLAHQIHKEQPLFSKLGARLDSRNQAQQHMQPREGHVIEVGSAKRANSKTPSIANELNKHAG